MRQFLIGVFVHTACADAALKRLEMRGFVAEALPAASSRSTDAAAIAQGPGARRLWFRIIDRAISTPSQAPREGEVHIKVRADSTLEAQAAREILQASGAQQSRCLGAGWANWSW